MTLAQTGENSVMQLEILHIDDCPNTELARERLTAALAAVGRSDLEVRMRRIRSVEDIAGTAFAGSPTMTANGEDLFPTPVTKPLILHAGFTPRLRGCPVFQRLGN